MPQVSIPCFICWDRDNIFVMRFLAEEQKTEVEGILAKILSATFLRKTEAMALPGMLQASSLGSSEGLKPVLTIPVLLLGLMWPPSSSLASLQKVQKVELLSCSYFSSLVCSSNTATSLLRALMNFRLTKSMLLKALQCSQASLRKKARESISNFLSQIAWVAYSFLRQRSTRMPMSRVSVLSLRQKGRALVEVSNLLKALVQPSIMMNWACMLSSPLESPSMFGHWVFILMQGRNWFVESRSHMASISPVMMQVDSLPLVRSQCCTVVSRVLGKALAKILQMLGSRSGSKDLMQDFTQSMVSLRAAC